jgi:hypothetical protein
MISSRRGILLAGIVISINLPAQDRRGRLLEYPVPSVREEQSAMVDGTEEVWRLKWNSTPKPFCDDVTRGATCPCDGFAYGERGDLDLVRLRRGAEIDRLNLTPLFKYSDSEDEAAVQRVALIESDWKSESGTPNLTGRPVVQVMHLADYNHDGLATEFFLQTDAKPCGKHYGVVVGTTRDNPRLHAFATVGHPDIPISMESRAWEKLRTAVGPVRIVDWLCDDHGSDEQVEFELTWSPKGIDGVRQTFGCAGDARGKLLTEEPL